MMNVNNTDDQKSTTVKCEVCEEIIFIKTVTSNFKYGIYSCEACQTFVTNMLNLASNRSSSQMPYILNCKSSKGNCILPPATSKSIGRKKTISQIGLRCKACWLTACIRQYNLPLEKKRQLLTIIGMKGLCNDKTDDVENNIEDASKVREHKNDVLVNGNNYAEHRKTIADETIPKIKLADNKSIQNLNNNASLKRQSANDVCDQLTEYSSKEIMQTNNADNENENENMTAENYNLPATCNKRVIEKTTDDSNVVENQQKKFKGETVNEIKNEPLSSKENNILNGDNDAANKPDDKCGDTEFVLDIKDEVFEDENTFDKLKVVLNDVTSNICEKYNNKNINVEPDVESDKTDQQSSSMGNEEFSISDNDKNDNISNLPDSFGAESDDIHRESKNNQKCEPAVDKSVKTRKLEKISLSTDKSAEEIEYMDEEIDKSLDVKNNTTANNFPDDQTPLSNENIFLGFESNDALQSKVSNKQMIEEIDKIFKDTPKKRIKAKKKTLEFYVSKNRGKKMNNVHNKNVDTIKFLNNEVKNKCYPVIKTSTPLVPSKLIDYSPKIAEIKKQSNAYRMCDIEKESDNVTILETEDNKRTHKIKNDNFNNKRISETKKVLNNEEIFRTKKVSLNNEEMSEINKDDINNEIRKEDLNIDGSSNSGRQRRKAAVNFMERMKRFAANGIYDYEDTSPYTSSNSLKESSRNSSFLSESFSPTIKSMVENKLPTGRKFHSDNKLILDKKSFPQNKSFSEKSFSPNKSFSAKSLSQNELFSEKSLPQNKSLSQNKSLTQNKAVQEKKSPMNHASDTSFGCECTICNNHASKLIQKYDIGLCRTCYTFLMRVESHGIDTSNSTDGRYDCKLHNGKLGMCGVYIPEDDQATAYPVRGRCKACWLSRYIIICVMSFEKKQLLTRLLPKEMRATVLKSLPLTELEKPLNNIIAVIEDMNNSLSNRKNPVVILRHGSPWTSILIKKMREKKTVNLNKISSK